MSIEEVETADEGSSTGGSRATDVIVVGGGLAGLTAATLLAREGRSVVLLERSRELGGRARTRVEDAFYLNLGPHALYKEGTGADVLRKLGVWPDGGTPNSGDSWAYRDGGIARLPSTPGSLLTTKLLGPLEKLGTAWALMRVTRADPGKLDGEDVESWLHRICPNRGARQLLEALVRLSTYGNDGGMAADAVAAKLQDVLAGVIYPDGGWQSIVDALADEARKHGVDVRTGSPVEALVVKERQLRGVRVRGEELPAGAVVVAVPVKPAAELLVDHLPGMEVTLRKALPARAATLDLGLERLPDPDRTFVLGIDRPLYFSVHSQVADLAPEGGAMVHASRYLAPGESPDADALEQELEEFLTVVQPGWRDVVAVRQFLPSMTVASATPRGSEGGVGARPGPGVPDVAGLFLAGDWVGPEGLLSDAAITSASKAAELATRFLAGEEVSRRHRVADYASEPDRA